MKLASKARKPKVYRVVRVTTIIETCYVRMPTRRLAEKWAKPSDARTCEKHSTRWVADPEPVKEES